MKIKSKIWRRGIFVWLLLLFSVAALTGCAGETPKAEKPEEVLAQSLAAMGKVKGVQIEESTWILLPEGETPKKVLQEVCQVELLLQPYREKRIYTDYELTTGKEIPRKRVLYEDEDGLYVQQPQDPERWQKISVPRKPNNHQSQREDLSWGKALSLLEELKAAGESIQMESQGELLQLQSKEEKRTITVQLDPKSKLVQTLEVQVPTVATMSAGGQQGEQGMEWKGSYSRYDQIQEKDLTVPPEIKEQANGS